MIYNHINIIIIILPLISAFVSVRDYKNTKFISYIEISEPFEHCVCTADVIV